MKDNITIVSAAIFILLALGAITFLYYQNQQLKNLLTKLQTSPSPSPTSTAIPIPTPTCKPRPACLDANPRCLIPETEDMCPPSPTPTPKACTLEAKICPDGSAVGRTGPNCEFAPCPGSTPQ